MAKSKKNWPNQKGGGEKEKKRKGKKERKFPIKDRKKIDEIYKKVFGPDDIWTNTELSPK